ncbi:MAG: DUF805 domain-containing protein [Deltaproteobacteria bacterium]|jgi:uncharacterized membrane protein YhaH (DUF805 family)|nr:DUF805 domain-containing protein [Deltaproteobacteria bacterium]
MDQIVYFFKTNLVDLTKEAYKLVGGRTNRRDYWMFMLAQMIIGIAVTIIVILIALIPYVGPVVFSILIFAYYFLTLLLIFPNFVLAIRRLHDANFSGWFVILCPFLVGYILLAFPSTRGDNKFGPQIII